MIKTDNGKVEEVDFSITTPSFNMLSYLKRCCASVQDQQGASFEHIVVDCESSDGTAAWLNSKSEIVKIIEPDEGMYDAVNKGWRAAGARFVSYLNCDEQYLPGTLAYVKAYFDAHPNVDVIFGDALLIRPDGSFIGYRKGYTPRRPFIATSHLYVLSCTMFLRRRVIAAGYLFDPQYKIIGDFDFVLRLLQAGFKAVHLKKYLSAFTFTGHNLSNDQNAAHEKMRLVHSLPITFRTLKYPLNVLRLIEKYFSGAYRQELPLNYAIYTAEPFLSRTEFTVTKAEHAWRWPVS
ncbi:MAG: glycosyltransferase [Ardenticatenaceae bacterium]|nr:glycosyltransferase [Ardenticatenaceae bacterium]MCB8987235.1 glycosyltransferase [Ardenticatenaceae bacterium]